MLPSVRRNFSEVDPYQNMVFLKFNFIHHIHTVVKNLTGCLPAGRQVSLA
jgi:hypothetical protein